MNTMKRTTVALVLALLAGCSTANHGPKAVATATPDQKAQLLDRVKALQGTWQIPPHDGQPASDVVFAVTSNGSAVREIMFPGSQHEMTNVYHMDGPTLVMTHYCAVGNQPRMRAIASGPSDPIDLKFDSVTNLASPDQSYMGGLKLVFVDANHIEEHWTNYANGKPDAHQMDGFKLVRKQ
jgi:hypothetical protein